MTRCMHPHPDLAAVLGYHRASAHGATSFAPGPERVDWATQPDPVRRWPGAPRLVLPDWKGPGAAWDDLWLPGRVPAGPLDLGGLARLLALSLGVSGRKADGSETWTLRCTPSSGNLHPVEAHVITGGLPGLLDGVHHYDPDAHALEHRGAAQVSPGLWIGLTAIHWREVWKYGLRAFRYTALDLGHAAAAIRVAAAERGWRAEPVSCGDTALAALLGLDEPLPDGAEPEAPEMLLRIGPAPLSPEPPVIKDAHWQGRPSRIDQRAPRDWPGLAEVAAATAAPAEPVAQARLAELPPPVPVSTRPAAEVIRARRSARRLTGRQPLARETLAAILDAALPRQDTTAGLWPVPAVHLAVFVHKVEELAPGLYLLPCGAADLHVLRDALAPGFLWERADFPLPLWLLAPGDQRKAARHLSCGQGIAAEGAVCLAILTQFREPVSAAPWRYRHLHWQAGAVGQALYLAATAAGIGGSGIGCFRDAPVHDLLGLRDDSWQVLYHFALGHPLPDPALRP